MLSEKNGEIQNLMTKLQRLEKVEVRQETLHCWKAKGNQTDAVQKNERSSVYDLREWGVTFITVLQGVRGALKSILPLL